MHRSDSVLLNSSRGLIVSKTTSLVLCSILALGALVLPVVAMAKGSAGPADPSRNSVLARVQASGAKLFYMGKQGGLDGWLIVKDGEIQAIYAGSDPHFALVGSIFGADGENLTAVQVGQTISGNMDGLGPMIQPAGTQPVDVADSVATPSPVSLGLSGVPTVSLPPIPQMNIPQVPQVAWNTPVANATSPSVFSPNAVPTGERLAHDLGALRQLAIGQDNAKDLTVIVDTSNSSAATVWGLFKEAVEQGKAKLRIIPVASLDSEAERVAANLVVQRDVRQVWTRFVAGDRSGLVGDADPSALIAVRSAKSTVDSWNIRTTPYLVYRGHDGKIKVVSGEVKDVKAVLADLN